jgi:hypothetical protein
VFARLAPLRLGRVFEHPRQASMTLDMGLLVLSVTQADQGARATHRATSTVRETGSEISNLAIDCRPRVLSRTGPRRVSCSRCDSQGAIGRPLPADGRWRYQHERSRHRTRHSIAVRISGLCDQSGSLRKYSEVTKKEHSAAQIRCLSIFQQRRSRRNKRRLYTRGYRALT